MNALAYKEVVRCSASIESPASYQMQGAATLGTTGRVEFRGFMSGVSKGSG